METQHTPGPWKSRRTAVYDIVEAADGGMVTFTSIREPNECRANVRLITAAPDLADLARNVAGFDDRLLLSADLSLLRQTLTEFRDQARAAIDKVTSAQLTGAKS